MRRFSSRGGARISACDCAPAPAPAPAPPSGSPPPAPVPPSSPPPPPCSSKDMSPSSQLRGRLSTVHRLFTRLHRKSSSSIVQCKGGREGRVAYLAIRASHSAATVATAATGSRGAGNGGPPTSLAGRAVERLRAASHTGSLGPAEPDALPPAVADRASSTGWAAARTRTAAGSPRAARRLYDSSAMLRNVVDRPTLSPMSESVPAPLPATPLPPPPLPPPLLLLPPPLPLPPPPAPLAPRVDRL